ncbi:MAG TPA: DUF1501 domain-containing protein [Planctomycetaceae bacterium]|nr:DUF1501 domain-containing protein [Planctomycetaceae bacterium]
MTLKTNRQTECGSNDHWNRRTLLRAATAGSISWLTPLATSLSRAAEEASRGAPAKSVIVLWMKGGPSQLETFDPHPNTRIGGETKAIKTSAPGIKIARGLDQVADQMENISLVRSVISDQKDHERATYNVKTGFRPDPTMIHPALGAVICRQLSDQLDIPRHISILPGSWPARGGYLGDQYDAFLVGDPKKPLPDLTSTVSQSRSKRRLDDLIDIVEPEFSRGRLPKLDQQKTLHRISINRAIKMMSSEQLRAFDVMSASQNLRNRYGDTPFGRGCLAACQLIKAGVRCVEVTLGGWDTHINNHQLQQKQMAILDPAMATLIDHLKEEGLLKHTIVLWGGEFGRDPRINVTDGRDHWPHGFTVAMAGGGIAGGQVIGATSPDPNLATSRPDRNVQNPRNIADIHATVLKALGIDFQQEMYNPPIRPVAISEGKVIQELLAS